MSRINSVRKGDVFTNKLGQTIVVEQVALSWHHGQCKGVVVFHEIGKDLQKRWVSVEELEGQRPFTGYWQKL